MFFVILWYQRWTWENLLPSLCVCVCMHVQSCPTLCNHMDCSLPGPLSIGFPRHEHWSGLLWHPPGDLPNPGIEPEPTTPVSPALQADSLLLSHRGSLRQIYYQVYKPETEICPYAKLWPTVCNPMDCSLPGFPVIHYPRVCSNSCLLSRWCYPTISSNVALFSSCP